MASVPSGTGSFGRVLKNDVIRFVLMVSAWLLVEIYCNCSKIKQEDLPSTQMASGGGFDQRDVSGSGDMWPDSRATFKVQPTRFVGGLVVGFEREESRMFWVCTV